MLVADRYYVDDDPARTLADAVKDDDACIANISKAGKTKDGYYAPAGA